MKERSFLRLNFLYQEKEVSLKAKIFSLISPLPLRLKFFCLLNLFLYETIIYQKLTHRDTNLEVQNTFLTFEWTNERVSEQIDKWTNKQMILYQQTHISIVSYKLVQLLMKPTEAKNRVRERERGGISNEWMRGAN